MGKKTRKSDASCGLHTFPPRPILTELRTLKSEILNLMTGPISSSTETDGPFLAFKLSKYSRGDEVLLDERHLTFQDCLGTEINDRPSKYEQEASIVDKFPLELPVPTPSTLQLRLAPHHAIIDLKARKFLSFYIILLTSKYRALVFHIKKRTHT